MHSCEGEMVCKSVNEKVPYFNAPIYLENKSQIGKVDEIFGPINEMVFWLFFSKMKTNFINLFVHPFSTLQSRFRKALWRLLSKPTTNCLSAPKSCYLSNAFYPNQKRPKPQRARGQLAVLRLEDLFVADAAAHLVEVLAVVAVRFAEVLREAASRKAVVLAAIAAARLSAVAVVARFGEVLHANRHFRLISAETQQKYA